MTSSSLVTLEEQGLDMQALSAASSYFFIDGDPWRISQMLSFGTITHAERAWVYDELWRRTYSYGEHYRYDMGHTEAVESIQKTNIDACGKRKNPKRKCSPASRH